MKKNFTRNDLIRYLYQETNPDESVVIEKSIERNPCLNKEYQELKNTSMSVLIQSENPSNEAVNKILLYSKCTEVLQGSNNRINVICKN